MCFIYIFIINTPYHNHFITFLPLIIYINPYYMKKMSSHTTIKFHLFLRKPSG